jgi:acylphosphatase
MGEVHLMDTHEHVVRVLVTGRVQGVGYRAFVEGEASRRGLKGWVRNRRDGSVEALFAGPPDVVDATIAACQRGPRSSRVDDVNVQPAEEEAIAGGFEVRPTA